MSANTGFDDTPIGNGGVAADGSAWLGLNYGRLGRLRLVTGYPEALDWSKDDLAPENDGIFIVDVKTGEKRLLVSYRQLDERLKANRIWSTTVYSSTIPCGTGTVTGSISSLGRDGKEKDKAR